MTIRISRLLIRLAVIGLLAYLGVWSYQWLSGHYIHWRYPLKYEEAIQAAAEANGLDPYLIAAVIRTESGFRADIVSSRGAAGVMQLMPETASWAAERMRLEGFETGQLFDPETNIAIGAWYLAELQREFDGRLLAALAAYNGGLANVKTWIQNGIWDGSYGELDAVPFRESRDFVRRVLDHYQIYVELYEGRFRQVGAG